MSNWKLAIPILMTVTGLLAMPQQKAPAGDGNGSSKELSGAEMYRIHCATCHGLDGKGGGVAASALKKTPPDLTQLAKKNNGQFPAAHVMRTIVGYEIEGVHGSHDMPIWGAYFRPTELLALSDYIRSIQQK